MHTLLWGPKPVLGSIAGDPLHMDPNCVDKGLRAAGVASALHCISSRILFLQFALPNVLLKSA